MAEALILGQQEEQQLKKLKLNGTLTLRSSAYIEGEVEIAKLSVEPGATFNAICSMKGGVKELKNSDEKGASEKKEKSA